ncbi:bifunctional rhamnulose-1-phosphate aldolase/short-chain dehydrogenase [Dongia rigui]|uniref:Bifunctional rhamnulose-1-phosphate aldolase/short-chain dehydrogenase n=1 Tax=Dongia rigui TaxID=940149 RepID=A0ABU5E330_9PROT|nr:bifunctional rhamnulose-1-phosphate aldolase/short-chain dehydrogenase [Dongia rigui]MDY0873777.1 bifunctional rhamnulose-1-phosphate aldolase/short-chain dehydrogenase [Dongia rigui]
MTSKTPTSDDVIPSLWDEAKAKSMSEPELLLYRSNLLGADLRITNYGGGNTSAKVAAKDPLTGESVTVLWVKGSGGDLGSMKLDGFSTLYLEKLEGLKRLYRGLAAEDEMVGYLPHCTFDMNPRAASIDTPLHAFIPYTHVDHMHPDAVIAIAAASRSKELTAEVFGPEIGWLPWQRPGFDLGLKLGEMATKNPQLKGIVLAGHGLFTWGDTSKACYDNTLRVIRIADAWLKERTAQAAVFGGAAMSALDPAKRREIAAQLMPAIRGRIASGKPKVGHFNDSPAVLEFVCAKDLKALAELGTSCPDHFLRTKIRPLVLDFDGNIEKTIASLDKALQAYRAEYGAYYDRCKRANSPAQRDANPIVYLIPGIGMVTFAADKATARIAGEFYVNAINVMRGASAVDTYVGLDEQEAFDIEYWLLEEAKLQRMPKAKALAGQIAFITGGAGGIGRATAEALLAEGACVALADIDAGRLEQTVTELGGKHGKDRVWGTTLDVTSENAVIGAFAATARQFGGIDILVSNAGIASASPIEETSLELWNKNISVLATGYFLVSREAFRLMKAQNAGGSMVFIASKNAMAASVNASAYCTAKAAEVHLARCLALEGAPLGIRVNVVNPDAVLRGSNIWSGNWLQERAEAYKIETDQLEEHYRQRSLLKLSVYPEDIAAAVRFFCTDAPKSTGNILNVDAGNAVAFTR